MNLKQRLVVLAMDFLLIGELAVCMYWGGRQPDDLTAFFVKTFLPAGAATVLAARLLIRHWREDPARAALVAESRR